MSLRCNGSKPSLIARLAPSRCLDRKSRSSPDPFACDRILATSPEEPFVSPMRLQSVDWKKLTHAYGTAEDIPSLLDGLSSGDPEEAEAALESLYMAICHQVSSVVEATSYTVPILLEMVLAGRNQIRDRVLKLLGDVA